MASNDQASDAATYAASVRAALSDLPSDQAEILLEDLEDHLREIAAEAEGSLDERLGPRTSTRRNCARHTAPPREANGGKTPRYTTCGVRSPVSWDRPGTGSSAAFFPNCDRRGGCFARISWCSC